ncbi:hypothetical protein ES708_28710 [subsurface metagenome]
MLQVCRDCILNKNWEVVESHILAAHKQVRNLVDLPSKPPKADDMDAELKCNLCINECILSKNDISYCGLRNIPKVIFTDTLIEYQQIAVMPGFVARKMIHTLTLRFFMVALLIAYFAKMHPINLFLIII